MAETQTNPVEEKQPNPYNAKKAWHKPDKPKMESADGLFYAPSEDEQATPSEDSETPPDKKSKDVNYKKRYDDLKKHYDNRLAEFKQKEQELLADAAEKAPKYKAPKTLEELQEFKRKNPDLYETVETVAHLQSENQTEALRQQLSSLQEREADILKREAETVLKERHPDFEDIRGDDAFHDWAKEQPEDIQRWVYANNSDATLASRAIDLYKMEKGISQSPQKRQSKKQERRSAADMVSTKTTAVDAKAPKVWTEREIANMSLDQFDRYEDEIKQALSEGRIAK
tara:strand:+ start:1979 stop:2833 length:855 start_codon:yes stop_codon:yes gene_type:complete